MPYIYNTEPFYIYHISHPETMDIVYIGFTQNIEQRAKLHINAKTDTGNWVRSIYKDGFEPVFTLIEKVTGDRYNVRERENYLIEKYKADGHRLFNRPMGCGKKALNFAVINNII